MKTAISIPDEIFVSADNLARRLNMSRSQLYTLAIKRYIEEIRHTGVRERLDRVYSSEAAAVDPAVLDAQAESISSEKW